MTPQEIISDDEITRVHGHANFGAMDPREVVNDGVRKTAVGYHCGSTQLHILREHGLVTKFRPGSSNTDLTKKGKSYARSIYRDTTSAAEAPVAETAGEATDTDKLRIAVEALEDISAGFVGPSVNQVGHLSRLKERADQALAALKSTAAQEGGE